MGLQTLPLEVELHVSMPVTLCYINAIYFCTGDSNLVDSH